MSDPKDNPVFEIALAYQKTAALIAAVKLDIFSVIGSQRMTAEELAGYTGASPRGLRILCDFLTVIELLKKEGSTYALANSARIMLDESSPFAIGEDTSSMIRAEFANA